MEILKIRKIQTVGTSLCVVLPADILRALKWERGDTLIFKVAQNDVVVLRKMKPEEFDLFKPDIEF